MFYTNKRPILILSTPRTGSTVLSEYVKKCCNDPSIRIFDEPENPTPSPRLDNFLKFYPTSENFILKTHLLNIHNYPSDISTFLTTSDSVFKIRIQRKDVIKQIASFYIATMRGRWHFRSENASTIINTVPIDIQLLSGHVQYITKANKVIQESTIRFDLDLIYEDLPKMDNLTYYVNPKPTNYQEILDAIKLVSTVGFEPTAS